MQTRRLGPFTVSAIGLGAMPFSFGEGADERIDRSVATVHAALDAGVTFIDTADIYAPSWDTMGHNERVVAKALAAYGDHDGIVVGTKGGITRSDGEVWARDASVAYLTSAVEKSLRNLEVDVIDLYQWHRPDHVRGYADVIQTFADLRTAGKIKAIGISNADVEEIQIAIDVLGPGGLASVQNEFSPRFRSSEPELELCAENDIAFLPWSPLGGGSEAKDVGGRFAVIGEIADGHGVSPQQVVLAWELALAEQVIPIPGASRPESIVDSAKAADLSLSADEVQALSDISLGIR